MINTAEGGWYAHVDYDLTQDMHRVYIVYGKPKERYGLSFDAQGDILMTRIDAEHPAVPSFRTTDLVGIVVALEKAVRRNGYQPDEEGKLRSELDAAKGTLEYAKDITDRLITYLTTPK